MDKKILIFFSLLIITVAVSTAQLKPNNNVEVKAEKFDILNELNMVTSETPEITCGSEECKPVKIEIKGDIPVNIMWQPKPYKRVCINKTKDDKGVYECHEYARKYYTTEELEEQLEYQTTKAEEKVIKRYRLNQYKQNQTNVSVIVDSKTRTLKKQAVQIQI